MQTVPIEKREKHKKFRLVIIFRDVYCDQGYCYRPIIVILFDISILLNPKSLVIEIIRRSQGEQICQTCVQRPPLEPKKCPLLKGGY